MLVAKAGDGPERSPRWTPNSSDVTETRVSPVLGEGVYCIYGHFSAHVATATVTYGESTGSYIASEAVVNGIYVPALCPSDGGAPPKALVLVRDFSSESASPREAGFYITLN